MADETKAGMSGAGDAIANVSEVAPLAPNTSPVTLPNSTQLPPLPENAPQAAAQLSAAAAPEPPPAPEPLIITPEAAAPGIPHTIDSDIANILKEVKLPERRTGEPQKTVENQAPAFGEMPTLTKESVLGEANGQNPAAGATRDPRLPPIMPEKPAAEVMSPVQALHTMKTDVQDFFRETKMSIVRAAAMKQDKAASTEPLPKLAPPAVHHSGRVVLLLTLALVLGAGAFFGISLYMNHAASPSASSDRLLFAESDTALSIDNVSSAALKQTLAAIMARQKSVGSIAEITPTVSTDAGAARPATLSEFFTALGISAPPDLMRALSDQFFFGVHAADVPSAVFIIPVTSYDHAFAGMLAWEPTMNSDLAPLYTQVPSLTPSQNGELPGAREFQDLVMRNYDVRALEDDAGSIVLYYSFPTPDILIIAGSPYTFPEVLSRLQAERKL